MRKEVEYERYTLSISDSLSLFSSFKERELNPFQPLVESMCERCVCLCVHPSEKERQRVWVGECVCKRVCVCVHMASVFTCVCVYVYKCTSVRSACCVCQTTYIMSHRGKRARGEVINSLEVCVCLRGSPSCVAVCASV